MTTSTSLSTFVALCLVALAPGAGHAEPLPSAAAKQADRCIAVIRARVQVPGTTRIRHTITDIRTVGARREFMVASAVYGSSGQDGQSFVSRCLAERWGDGAELKWVRPVPEGRPT